MARRADNRMLGVEVYDRVRAEILSGAFAPGTPLRLAQLASSYNVGPGVIREVLTRLAEQGLVVAEHNKGFRLVSPADDSLDGLLEARVLNECAAFEMSIRNSTLDWQSRVVAAHHRLAHTPMFDEDDPNRVSAAYAAAHRDFHFTLLSGCKNRYLLDMCERLYDLAGLLRKWSVSANAPRPGAAEEHAELMEAALDSDVARATKLYREHLEATAQAVVDLFGTAAPDESGDTRLSG